MLPHLLSSMDDLHITFDIWHHKRKEMKNTHAYSKHTFLLPSSKCNLIIIVSDFSYICWGYVAIVLEMETYLGLQWRIIAL